MILENPILVVDDEVEMRIAMSTTLKKCGFKVELSHSAADALNKFKKKDYSLIITDMTMPKRSGVELLKDIKAINSKIPVIIMTAHGTIETAIESMKYGAFDYILKPFDFDMIIFLIERALTYNANQRISETTQENAEQTAEADDITLSDKSRDIITSDPSLKEILSVAKSVAQSKATVLIQSESGTGKELLARFIHDHSDRKNKPFVAINCAALPENLLESELFGHKKGSFTGAINDHKGKFEQANGGTILLDEISEMVPHLQAKLLRVLQEQVVDRIGGSELIALDVRIVATTNRNLHDYVEEGKFREDLFFRLNVIPLRLPPLRERKGDIRLLAEYFVKKHAEKSNIAAIPSIHEDTFRVLENYNWRGNVRELENVIERALILCSEKTIVPTHLLMNMTLSSSNTMDHKPPPSNITKVVDSTSSLTLKEAEQQHIIKSWKKNKGDLKKTAAAMAIDEADLKKKLKLYVDDGLDIGYTV